ncbi:site-2 protease family protein [archaeon]|jgi:membrane-associated protease RseP (regulator of RpoE activity)|nr:site-2 protease family protein [archaeon]MBT3578229.1 site-2 protease family protein [archaeon]MBT6819850.1 site-2 protease family protein [archaeon]MBT6955737.1 site-2 protease family protein [archaeon]MBT7025632.1 site-2 protease family protein [archaeon]
MVSFVVYDLAFLVIFSIFVAFFLYKKRNTGAMKREGIIFMYRTQLGVRAINWVGDNLKKTLSFLKYIIVAIGLALMAGIIWLLGQTLWIYVSRPDIMQYIKAPPIAPLIPYFPKLFGMESFFPPFYFTYFIVALAIVAVAHEFSHGIFMRRFGIKIKSTGLVFLGPILGAFVEENRNQFEKKGKLEQMTVLGAGVFANVVLALIFYGLYVAFFAASFSPGGYIFNTYATSSIPLANVSGFIDEGNLTAVIAGNETYYLDEGLATQLRMNASELFVYLDTPAVRVGLRGAIVQANDVKILDGDSLREFLESKNPGDEVTFTTEMDGIRNDYKMILDKHPSDPSRAYMGVGFRRAVPTGLIQKLFSGFMKFKEPSTHYIPSWDGDFVYFFYHLLWWVMIINLLVAFFNMMPLGMLDGGRFFYLTILSITRSDKFAKGLFKVATYAILFLFLLLMFFWFIRII